MQGGSVGGSTPQTSSQYSQFSNILASGHSSIDRQLESLFKNISQLVVDESGSEKGDSKKAPEGAPPLQDPDSSVSVNDMIYMMGELSSKASNSAITAEQQYNELLNKVAQQQARDQIDQANKAADQQSKSQHKSGIAKIFGWVTSIASIVAGAILCATGVGAGLGAALIVGGVMGCVMQTKLGADIVKGMGELANLAFKIGQFMAGVPPQDIKNLPKEVQQVLGAILTTVAMVVLTLGVGSLAAAEAGAEEAVQVGTEMALDEGAQAGETGANATQAGTNAAETGATTASEAGSMWDSVTQTMSRLTDMIRSMNVMKVLQYEQLLVGLTNVGLETSAAVGAYQAQMAEGDAIAAKAAFTNTENFIKMANNTLTDMLKTLQSSISAAVQTLGQSASVTANIMGSA